MPITSKDHWDTVYKTKTAEEVSWTQAVPKTSLDFIHLSGLPKSARIIDIGGGDSTLVDHLLNEGYEHVTVLDISEKALDRAQRRLGDRATRVKWIVSDITDFTPTTTYDLWHDRATFHFLTTTEQTEAYLNRAQQAVTDFLMVATFSTDGPTLCSGLPVRQYSQETLTNQFRNGFKKNQCLTDDHLTPFHTVQPFLFCSFQRTQPNQSFQSTPSNNVIY